jgi:hypothetical protein
MKSDMDDIKQKERELLGQLSDIGERAALERKKPELEGELSDARIALDQKEKEIKELCHSLIGHVDPRGRTILYKHYNPLPFIRKEIQGGHPLSQEEADYLLDIVDQKIAIEKIARVC